MFVRLLAFALAREETLRLRKLRSVRPPPSCLRDVSLGPRQHRGVRGNEVSAQCLGPGCAHGGGDLFLMLHVHSGALVVGHAMWTRGV